MRIIRILVAIPLIAILVVFALSNRSEATLSFLGYEVACPLSVAILVAAAIAFLLGALVMWFGELRQRRRARRSEQRVSVLEAELERLRPRDAPGEVRSLRVAPGAIGAPEEAVPTVIDPAGVGPVASIPVSASPASRSLRP